MPRSPSDTLRRLRHPSLYVAHPRFSMAGIWQLNLTISRPNAPPQRATVTVSVRWS